MSTTAAHTLGSPEPTAAEVMGARHGTSVPSDWPLVALGTLCSFANGVNADKAAYGKGVPFINVLEVITHSHLRASDIPGRVLLSEAARETFAVRRGDVLFNRTSETQEEVGLSAVYDDDEAVVFGGFVVRGRFTVDAFDRSYAGYALRAPLVRSQIIAQGQGAIRANVGQASLQRIVVPVPSKPEQRAIAETLSDVDGLLGALEALIAKKRAIKQAAMQQLLTGKTRLPGFSGAWEVTTFGDVVRHHAGNSALIKGKLASSGAGGLFPAYSASGQDVWCGHFEHEGEAIVVSAVGSRCGKAFAASGRWCAIANTHIVWPNAEKVDRRFLEYHINDEEFWLKSGTGQPFVLFTPSFARPLRLPSLPEQTAIATALSDMDVELFALEARRHKTLDIKQGMMQQLLSGRVRLVGSEAAA